MADTIKHLIESIAHNNYDASDDWEADVSEALAEIKRIVSDCEPEMLPFSKYPIGDREAYFKGVSDYQDNLMEALGESIDKQKQ